MANPFKHLFEKLDVNALQEISLENSRISFSWVDSLNKSFTSLKALILSNNSITDPKLLALLNMLGGQDLEYLGAQQTQITPSNIGCLNNSFPKLNSLDLSLTQVTDAAVCLLLGKLDKASFQI